MNLQVWTGLITIGLCGSCLTGCGDGRTKFNLAKTSGTVMCDGKPVPFATVYFEPVQSDKNAKVGKQGIGYADQDGYYVLTTYDKDDGAVVGKHRVRVGRALGPASKDFKCDCAVSEEVDVMNVEVIGGEVNEFDIALKKETSAAQSVAAKRGAQDAEVDD